MMCHFFIVGKILQKLMNKIKKMIILLEMKREHAGIADAS